MCVGGGGVSGDSRSKKESEGESEGEWGGVGGEEETETCTPSMATEAATTKQSNTDQPSAG